MGEPEGFPEGLLSVFDAWYTELKFVFNVLIQESLMKSKQNNIVINSVYLDLDESRTKYLDAGCLINYR